jgi:hypothetical protein
LKVSKAAGEVEVSFGTAGIHYVASALERGGALSHWVGEHIDLASGDVYGYFSKPEVRAGLEDLSDGLDDGEAARNSAATLQMILEFIRHGPDRVVLFEHPWAAPGAPFLSRVAVPHFALDQSVIFPVDSGRATSDQVEQSVGWAGAQELIGVLARTPGDVTWRNIRRQDLDDRLQLIHRVVVRAFDAEGYLVWKPAR